MSAQATLDLLRAAQEGDQRACEQIVEENSGLIWSIVRRYYGRGVEVDDLYQLGCLGFLKAVQGFDFTYGTCFSTYAVPKIAGEIRRFLRDDGAIKVGRTIRERAALLYGVRERLRFELGREPALSELSESTGLTPEEIARTELATDLPDSLQRETEDGLALEGMLGTEAPEDGIVERLAVRQAVEALPEKERMTILLRYFRGFTQEQTARILKVSQVQISRLERRGLERLRRAFEPWRPER
ncbi:sigma-70 family RNA polymerase sigma factor [Oscillibacter sp.]|uniref:sigma-70 family RNA polymerase sigma factor n=1 Tax=Oscillibacter sp. TaxID=1945593 RepID=UPI0028A1FF76|nr:sigma-70 family RNA polymerase sigma factor [Oscillibacter sp.]